MYLTNHFLDSQLRPCVICNKDCKDTITTQVSKRSSMERLAGHTTRDRKIGHMMEDVIIKVFVNETRTKGAAVTCKELKCAFKVGLVEHKTIQGLRCFPDT